MVTLTITTGMGTVITIKNAEIKSINNRGVKFIVDDCKFEVSLKGDYQDSPISILVEEE